MGVKVHDGVKMISPNGLTTKILDIDDTGVLTFDNNQLLGVPSGAVQYFAMSTAPNGWLKANGAEISRTVYSSLFSAIGTTFGAGNGSTTFNLPDMRGYFQRGWDDGRGIDSGRAFGSTQTDDNKSHDHQYGLGYTNSSSMWHTTYSAALAAGDSNVFTTSGYTGIKPSGGTEARPKNIALLACIKY